MKLKNDNTQTKCQVVPRSKCQNKRIMDAAHNIGQHWKVCQFETLGYNADHEYEGESFCLFHSQDNTDLSEAFIHVLSKKPEYYTFNFIIGKICIPNLNSNFKTIFTGSKLTRLQIDNPTSLGVFDLSIYFNDSEVNTIIIKGRKLNFIEIRNSLVSNQATFENCNIEKALITNSQFGLETDNIATCTQEKGLKFVDCKNINSLCIKSSTFYAEFHLMNCQKVNLLNIDKDYRSNKQNEFKLVPYIEENNHIDQFISPKSMKFYKDLVKKIKKNLKKKTKERPTIRQNYFKKIVPSVFCQNWRLSLRQIKLKLIHFISRRHSTLIFDEQYRKAELLYKHAKQKSLSSEAANLYYLKQKLYEKSNFNSFILRRLSWIYGFFGGYGVNPFNSICSICGLALLSIFIYTNYGAFLHPFTISNIGIPLVHSLENTLPISFFNNLPLHMSGLKSLFEKIQLSLGTLFWGFLLIAVYHNFRK